MKILISISGLHSDARYFKDPEEFKPERFTNHKSANFSEFPFFPFGDGARECLAFRLAKIQLKIPIVLLLQKFRIELDDRHIGTKLEIDPKNENRIPINGIHLKFIPH